MTKFWDAFGGKVAESWVAQLITAPALYVGVGFGAWVAQSGWDDSGRRVTHWFNSLSGTEQGLIAVGGLALSASASTLVGVLVPTVLKWLEGYWPWPLKYLAPWKVGLATGEMAEQRNRAKELELARNEDSPGGEGGLSPAQEAERDELNLKLRRLPANDRDRLPTRLGNILRAAEYRPRDKYGLDAVIVWPHLWLVLQGSTKDEIGDARTRLDQAISGVIWGVALVAWAPIAWWTILCALAVGSFFYYSACTSAAIYGDLMEAAFDLERTELYRKLRLPLPDASGSERESGEALTQYLFRGQGSFTFTT